MITLKELKAAIETGHKASSVLRDVLAELDQKFMCYSNYGPCNECISCLAKRVFRGEEWYVVNRKTKKVKTNRVIEK